KSKDPSLSSGSAGLAILFAYLNQAHEQKKYLKAAIDGLQKVRMGSSLYSGFTGIVWTKDHLQKRNGEKPTESEVDTILAKYLQSKPWRADYDLVSGLVGFGVYALERLPNPEAKHCAELIVDRLAEIRVEDRNGIAWFTNPEVLPEWQRERCPDGYYNLGLAH